jgi:hypothetical protein
MIVSVKVNGSVSEGEERNVLIERFAGIGYVSFRDESVGFGGKSQPSSTHLSHFILSIRLVSSEILANTYFVPRFFSKGHFLPLGSFILVLQGSGVLHWYRTLWVLV